MCPVFDIMAFLGRMKEEFHNKETYYKMHGAKLHLPRKKEFKPKPEFITWHKLLLCVGRQASIIV